jgi:hypothetical protein
MLKGPPGTASETSFLAVLRRQDGDFIAVTAVSASGANDDAQFWRLLKVDARVFGENIKQGDTVQLAWRFADQTAGYRDFVDDYYGRYQMEPPVDYSAANMLSLQVAEGDSLFHNAGFVSSNALPVPPKDIVLRDTSGDGEISGFQTLTFRLDRVGGESKVGSRASNQNAMKYLLGA